MANDYLGLSDVDLGTLKSAFLTPSRDNVLYTDVLSTAEVAEYMSRISSLSREDKIKLAIQKINDIYTGKYSDENDLNRQEAIIVLILKSIPFEKSEADTYWKSKAESGIHDVSSKKVLIEVAANHPLIEGKPGKEFTEHLEQAIELYYLELEKGNEPIIYVPGSLHYIVNKETGKADVDMQPLSEAGKEYLISRGIPASSIRANVVNLDIKGEDGVYNSGDECYVATQIAKAENCGRIMSVVSPVQLYRKALFYQEFGFNPELYATGTEKTNHNYIGELFWSLYLTYMNDQDWQTGFLSYLTRKERDIDYSKRSEDFSEYVEAIIKNGPGIPQEVFDKKKEWLEIYGRAQENMSQANESKNDILINLVRVEDKQELEQKRILDLIKQYPESQITITYDSNTNMEDILDLLSKHPDAKISLLPMKEPTVENLTGIFKSGDFKKIYTMYPSSMCMKKSVAFIKNGIIPIVSTIPDKSPNYIENISQLFDEVMEPLDQTKDQSDNNPEL